MKNPEHKATGIAQSIPPTDSKPARQYRAKHPPDEKMLLELQETLTRLLPHYGGILRNLTRALHLPRGLFNPSTLARKSATRLQKHLNQLKRLESQGTGNVDTAPALAKPKRATDAPTSDQEIPPLTSVNFRFFEYTPDSTEIKVIAQTIVQARIMLERCAQIRDDAVRANVRNALSEAVENLELAIRLFTQEFPNKLIHLFDAEREGMKLMQGLHPKQRPIRTQRR